MTELSKEYFDKQLTGIKSELRSEIKASEKRILKHVDKKIDQRIDDVNARTARGFTETQTQINTIQRQLNDADLPQIKRDNKALKQAVGIPA